MEHFVARQPIFDRRKKIYAYELLFRSGLGNYFDHKDGDEASSRVIANSILLFGIENMTGAARAFINFTQDLLVKNYALTLPKQWTVVEVLENVEPDAHIVDACKKIKDNGYILALDDFVYNPKYEPLLDLTDIVKVDFMLSDSEERKLLSENLIPRGIKLLAEKVETQDDFQEAYDLGYSYFQGYFFSKPVIVSRKDIPTSKLQYLRILREVNSEELDFRKLSVMIEAEVSMSYKLLKYINSAFFGFSHEITTIKQALGVLGEREVKKWVSLVSLAAMASDKPDELIVSSLVRAKFMELTAGEIDPDGKGEDFFLLGLFSMLDAIVDRPLAEIMADIPVSEGIKSALLRHKGAMYPLLALMISFERGDWKRLSAIAKKVGIKEALLPEKYVQAIQWTNEMVYGG